MLRAHTHASGSYQPISASPATRWEGRASGYPAAKIFIRRAGGLSFRRGQQLGDLGQMPEPAVGRGHHDARQVSRAVWSQRRHRQARYRSDRPHVRQPPKRVACRYACCMLAGGGRSRAGSIATRAVSQS